MLHAKVHRQKAAKLLLDISSNNPTACSQAVSLQALMAALKLKISGKMCARFMVSKNSRASCHWFPFSFVDRLQKQTSMGWILGSNWSWKTFKVCINRLPPRESIWVNAKTLPWCHPLKEMSPPRLTCADGRIKSDHVRLQPWDWQLLEKTQCHKPLLTWIRVSL